ncbi:MAG TPA: HD domain-containing phosphohydrolase [Pirellulaceae bacterium]|nr:HD domain-containing phosphohydrolase [Pirellulaceae bacterium]
MTNESSAVAERRGFFPTLVTALIGLPELRCDVYIQPEGNARKVLYRGADSNLSIAQDATLQERGVRHLFLKEEDRERYERALAEASPPEDASVMLALTIERRRDAFETAILGGSPSHIVATAEEIARDVLQVVNHDGFAVSEAMSLLHHDKSTFQHSCNVSIYAATLAKRLGLSDAELTSLIAGGMVHDVGKRDIPGYILRKPGLLDARERELIRQHPAAGFRMVAPLGKLTWAQLMMVYQHHERIDGTGYPVGAFGEEIHLWGRLCAVADVFDALTAKRSYREPGTAAAAIAIMQGETGHFDLDLLRLWTETVT